MEEKFTKGDLMKLLKTEARSYKLIANDSLRRNFHMNNSVMEERKNISQEIVDALLVDFINYVGVGQGMDYM